MKNFVLVALCLCVACDSESDSVSARRDITSSAESRYVIATAVSDDNNANTYVAALDSLDVEELDLSNAREFGGWSDIGVVGDWVFVSSGEAPTIERFTVDATGKLQDDGSIDFSDYTNDANFYSQTLVSPTKAYLVAEGEFVIWDPSKLEITGTLKFPDEVAPRDGIEGFVALDRGGVVRGDRLYATLTWTDTEQLNMLPDSRIVVIDIEKDEVVEVLEAPCPDLSVASRDDAGNLYFSNWVYSPGATLINDAAPACVVRIARDSDTVDDWKFAFAEETGSEGATMNFLGDGRWLYSTFHGTLDEYNPNTDEWFDWLFGDKWQLNAYDPSDGSSTEVEGIPRNGGGYYSARFEDVTHVLIPGESYTSTTVYALDPEGGAQRKLHTQGWSTRLFKLP